MGFGIVVHLSHAVSSQVLSHVAPANAKVDFGAIARRFHLDPNSVTLNGHFISRGANHISNLTWNQVLSFFVKRGYAYGHTENDPVRVDGRRLISGFNEDTKSATSEEMKSKHKYDEGVKKRVVHEVTFSRQKRRRHEPDPDFRPFSSKETPQGEKFSRNTGKRLRDEDVSTLSALWKRMKQIQVL